MIKLFKKLLNEKVQSYDHFRYFKQNNQLIGP